MRILPFIRSHKACLIILLSFYRIWLIKSHSRFWTWNNRVRQRLSTSTADKSVDDDIASSRQNFVRHLAIVARGGDHIENGDRAGQNQGSEEDVGGGSDYDNEMEEDELNGIDRSNADKDVNDVADTEDSFAGDQSISSPETPALSESEVSPFVSMTPQRKNRHSSDVIIDLSQRSVVDDGEQSWALRQLITARTSEFLIELERRTDEIMILPKNERSDKKLPHPRKLLHFLAPKIPAIKQSPDVNLRIHSSRSDIDPGCAACIIGMLAHACELYDGNVVKIGNSMERSASFDIIDDRRFEQLVECVIAGINIEKRIRESTERDRQLAEEESNKKKKHRESSSAAAASVIENDIDGDDGQPEEQMTDIEDVLDQEDVQFDEGIGIRDACRAAYGIAVLGTQQVSSLGGVVINDLILALSLRVRELLLARLQLLRRDDILEGTDDGVTTEERLDELSEELAQDTASTLWAFACVRVLTGCRSAALIETCCGILCSQPKELRHRAQEAPYESGSSIGSSDVIERLARSESESLEPELESIESDIRQNPGVIDHQSGNDRFGDQYVIDQRDILLDWLSPTEVADMLWGIALHGSSNETSVKDEIDLTVTATSLREAASDRIIEWLKNDLRVGRDTELNNGMGPSTSITTTESIENDKTKVEVMKNGIETADVQSAEDDVGQDKKEDGGLASTQVLDEPEMQEVPVVDAASLLSSYNSEKEMQVETEVFVAPVPVMESDEDAYGETTDRVRPTNSVDTIFSSHDLASIAWSLTELNDTCKVQIMGMVMERLSQLEPFGVANLSGNDLSNLAWAISKDSDAPVETALSIISSIITTSLENARDIDILEFLQPPELGRLMWASAWVSTRKEGGPVEHQDLKSMRAFSDMGLNAAAEFSNVFNPEELARILYAWLELSDPDYTNLDLKTSESLGRVVSTIEQSLQRWEKGDLPTGPSRSNSQISPPTTLFGSVFGRSRFNPLMEHAVVHTEEEDDLRYHRPKLRDLNLDPSTLIKITLGVNRLSHAQKSMVGLGHVLTRIAVRLMSSKSGKLMRVCSVDDIARLCEAACLSSDRFDLSIGYFSRQVVQVLNEGVDCSDLQMQKKCTLVWSLGRLGIRCSLDTADKHKLDATYVSKILKCIDLSKLELESLCRLLEGLLTTKYVMVSDSTFFLELLTYLERILHQEAVSNNDILCDVVETLGVLMEEEIRTKESSEGIVDTKFDTEDNGDEGVSEDDSPGERTILAQSQSILRLISSLIRSRSHELTSSQICRILGVYCMVPFQADDMVESIEEEISVRRSILESLLGESGLSLEVLLRRADEEIENLQSTLFEESSTSIFDSLKAGFVSFFSLDEEASTADDDLGRTKEEVASLIRDCLSASSAPSRRIAKDSEALKKTIGTLIKESEDVVALELGKAEELTRSYRRVEFVDGVATSRQSRYDQQRREIITKRVLSRLLP